MLAREALLLELRLLARELGWGVKPGKMVLEVGPDFDVDKGTALTRLAREHRLTSAIALGDDLTDCAAFGALHALTTESGLEGAAVAVVDAETPEPVLLKADYRLEGRGEVGEFLHLLAG